MVKTETAQQKTETPTTQPTAEKKLPPALAAAVRCGKVAQRIAKLEGAYGRYAPEVKEALNNARKWTLQAKAACEQLGAGFRLPDARKLTVKFVVGAQVTLRDRRRALYATLITDAEVATGLPITGLYDNMVAVQTAQGVAMLPRAHHKRAG